METKCTYYRSVTLWTNKSQNLQSFTFLVSCSSFFRLQLSLRQIQTHRIIPWALNLEKLSGSVLCFLSVSSMCRRLFCLYACDFSGKDGWKKLDKDVRPTFLLEAGYPLSKHSWIMNQTGRHRGVRLFFKGVMMYEGPADVTVTTKCYLFLFHLFLCCRLICFVTNWTGKRLHGWVARPSVCPLGWVFGVVYGQWLSQLQQVLCAHVCGSCLELCPYCNQPQKPQAFSSAASWIHISLLFACRVSLLLTGHSVWVRA